jgi:eukaryotic-like serine/threonine-protein kinase
MLDGMSIRPTCPRCGMELPAGSSSWLCPKCLLANAVTGQHEPAQTPPPLAEQELPSGGVFAEALPRRLGDCQLLERIGEGGMGVVYRARQARLDRIVAVKVLPFGRLANKEFVHRFRTEAVAAGSLQHPNIVGIHEVGLDGGQHYLVMDFVAGPTLAELARDGPLPARRAARYVQLIAEAVHFAHERNILHRDLKPSNVLIDANDQPRVTDFGLAKRLESGADLTLSGQVLGSPGYLPPEQASGQRGRIGRRSDVYALGAILYHLLAGRAPFVASEVADALRQVLNDEPVALRLLNPKTPRDLETICLKCLEKEPARRYPTAHALAEELGRYLRDEPILSRPASRTQKLWRWCHRKPALAGLGAAVAGLLLVLGIGGPIVAAQQRALAERNRRLLYASDLKVAYQAWEQANMPYVVELLDRNRPGPRQTDLREFTWWHVRGLCEPYLRTPTLTHGGPVFMLSVSRDRRWLVASGSGGEVTVWDLAGLGTGRKIDTHDPYAKPTAISPDSRLLVILSGPRQGGNLSVWDLESGVCLHRNDGGEIPFRMTADFSPDGATLAVGRGSDIVLLDVHDWDAVQTYRGHGESIWEARFAPDGQRLACGSTEGTIRILDVATGSTLQTLRGHQGIVYGVAFASDGQRLASAGGDRTVRLWNTVTGEEIDRYPHAGQVWAVDFSPDGTRVASGSHDGLVRVHDPATRQIHTLRGHAQTVRAVRFVQRDSILASGSTDGTVKLWDLRTLAVRDELEARGAMRDFSAGMARPPLAFFPDGSHVVTASTNGNAILVWQTVSGALHRRVPLERDSTLSADTVSEGRTVSIVELALSSRDSMCAVACDVWANPATETNHVVELWNLTEDRRTCVFPGGIPLAFSGDGAWLVAGGIEARALQITNLTDGRAWTTRLEAGQPRVDAVAFSPDGRLLAAACECELVLFETSSGRHVSTLSRWGNATPINALGFAPDGRTLAVGRFDPQVELWDVVSGKLRAKWPGHLAQVMSLAISPDGRTLASGDQNGALKLWSLERREELLHLQTHTDGVYALAFSPDGSVLASGGGEGGVRLWRTAAREP